MTQIYKFKARDLRLGCRFASEKERLGKYLVTFIPDGDNGSYIASCNGKQLGVVHTETIIDKKFSIRAFPGSEVRKFIDKRSHQDFTIKIDDHEDDDTSARMELSEGPYVNNGLLNHVYFDSYHNGCRAMEIGMIQKLFDAIDTDSLEESHVAEFDVTSLMKFTTDGDGLIPTVNGKHSFHDAQIKVLQDIESDNLNHIVLNQNPNFIGISAPISYASERSWDGLNLLYQIKSWTEPSEEPEVEEDDSEDTSPEDVHPSGQSLPTGTPIEDKYVDKVEQAPTVDVIESPGVVEEEPTVSYRRLDIDALSKMLRASDVYLEIEDFVGKSELEDFLSDNVELVLKINNALMHNDVQDMVDVAAEVENNLLDEAA